MPHTPSSPEAKVGLPYWADRVLDEQANLGGDLPAKGVHDLRVAMRRCMSIAEIMESVDPACDWKAMRKSARRTFHRLGAHRDAQVLSEWFAKLGFSAEESAKPLLDALRKQQEADRSDAHAAVRAFDRKEWRSWRRECARHYRHVVADRPACESLVLELWQEVSDLNRRAQRSQSLLAYHRLRVGIKKFRYAAENFLPSTYPGWERDLKMLQDLLGEIHDLTVLDQMLVKHRNLVEPDHLAPWRARLKEERAARLKAYRAAVAGKSSPLRIWREGLPAEKDLRATGLARLAEWGYFVTPDFSAARRSARLALQLYDGLLNSGLIPKDARLERRLLLHAAALLQEAGRFKQSKAHHKKSYRMIRKLHPPPGWTKQDLQFTAILARFHRRALPYPDHAILRGLDVPLRQSLIRLAAILRIADGFRDGKHHAIRRLQVENGPGFLVIRAEGFSDRDAIQSKLSEARRFLEFVFQRSVHILAPGTRMLAPRIVKPASRSDAA